MRGQAAIMSSARTGTGRDDWRTPPDVLAAITTHIGRIQVDPCASYEASGWFAEDLNITEHDRPCGLAQDWQGRGLVFVNPPYSKFKWWAKKANEESVHTTPILLLVPARTDTKAWRLVTQHADCVAFWRGRITFVGAENGAPFPSAIVAHNIGRRAMLRAFGDVADVWSCP